MYEYISAGCFSTRRSVDEGFLRSICLDISIQEQVVGFRSETHPPLAQLQSDTPSSNPC
jgi:hypothetical protein